MKHGIGAVFANAFYRLRRGTDAPCQQQGHPDCCRAQRRFCVLPFSLASVLYFEACFGSDVSGAFISVNLLLLAYITYYRWRGLHSGGVQLTFLLLFVVFSMTVCCELISNDSGIVYRFPEVLP